MKSVLLESHDAQEQIQIVIAASKLQRANARRDGDDIAVLVQIFLNALAKAKDDPIMSQIVWQNLHPRLESQADALTGLLRNLNFDQRAHVAMLPRIIDRLIGRQQLMRSRSRT